MNIVVVAQEAAGVKTVQLVEQSPHHLAAVLTGSEHDETNGRGVTVRAAARKLGAESGSGSMRFDEFGE